MTSSIPDGLSFAQLQEMMAEAKSDSSSEEKILTAKEIADIIIPAVTVAREEIGDISAYKHIAMYSMVKLFEFHNEVALEQMDDNEHEAALCWARDAGWLQNCLNTLRQIGCGPNDFFTRESGDDA